MFLFKLLISYITFLRSYPSDKYSIYPHVLLHYNRRKFSQIARHRHRVLHNCNCTHTRRQTHNQYMHECSCVCAIGFANCLWRVGLGVRDAWLMRCLGKATQSWVETATKLHMAWLGEPHRMPVGGQWQWEMETEMEMGMAELATQKPNCNDESDRSVCLASLSGSYRRSRSQTRCELSAIIRFLD